MTNMTVKTETCIYCWCVGGTYSAGWLSRFLYAYPALLPVLESCTNYKTGITNLTDKQLMLYDMLNSRSQVLNSVGTRQV